MERANPMSNNDEALVDKAVLNYDPTSTLRITGNGAMTANEATILTDQEKNELRKSDQEDCNPRIARIVKRQLTGVLRARFAHQREAVNRRIAEGALKSQPILGSYDPRLYCESTQEPQNVTILCVV